ncbi:MAG: hypothetical protein ACTSX7_16560 [Alphaproteobacteria bacterium]
MTESEAIAEGAHNLLVNCAALEPGESVLIVAESPDLGWYDAEVVQTVAEAARNIGFAPTMLEIGGPSNDRDPGVIEAMAAHDCTIFFARLGDQDRFEDPVPGKRRVMCYLRDTAMLGAPYGRTTHLAFLEIKRAVDEVLLSAERIEISCPLGTAYSGTIAEAARQQAGDVSVRRFPLGVPTPMDAGEFSGRVAVSRYLTPTGSSVYEPANLALASTIFAEVEMGRITDFTGDDAGEIERVRNHYRMVAEQFGIDGDVVHSWHAGIHPACAYDQAAADNPDRWSNSAFGNPRLVHFHTCGAYAPGEICWIVLDQTIRIDGVSLWENGRLRPEAFAQTNACLEKWPVLVGLFAHPADEIGVPS